MLETTFHIVVESRKPVDTNHVGQMIHNLLAKVPYESRLKDNVTKVTTLLVASNVQTSTKPE